MNKLFNKETFVQAVKYGLVGVLNTLISLGVYSLFAYVFNFNYLLANTISYVVGVINSFLWNKLWTFKSKQNGSMEMVWFVVIFLVSFGIQNGCLIFFKEALKLSKFWAYVLSMPIYPLISFLGNKFITFRPKKGKPQKKGAARRS